MRMESVGRRTVYCAAGVAVVALVLWAAGRARAESQSDRALSSWGDCVRDFIAVGVIRQRDAPSEILISDAFAKCSDYESAARIAMIDDGTPYDVAIRQLSAIRARSKNNLTEFAEQERRRKSWLNPPAD